MRSAELPEPTIGKVVAGTIRRPAGRIHFAMRTHGDLVSFDFAAAIAQIADQFFAGIELCAGRLVTIEIADETDA